MLKPDPREAMMRQGAQGWTLFRDRADAPPPFVWEGKTVVPVEFSQASLTISIDVGQRQATGRAQIAFMSAQPGYPLLDMVPSPTSLLLDGSVLPLSAFPEISPPDQQADIRVLQVGVEPAVVHHLTVEYPLDGATVAFTGDGGVRLAFFMTDLEERGYLERHAPANLEFNQFPLTLEIQLAGARKKHALFTNGQSSSNGGDAWTVVFPGYFSASSFYLHLTDREFHTEQDRFAGVERSVPVLAYGERRDEVQKAVAEARAIFEELERTYGPYAHETLTIYVTDELNGGGMEYCGATMTGLGALGHEILHSWFARGVMPANGNAGWIDEGIARWRDYGYPTRSPDPNREPVNLAGFSPYRRHTPRTAYAMGSLLLSELDHMFKQDGSGMLPLLSKLYLQKRRQQITTDYFKAFLEAETGRDLGSMFDHFVYGRQLGEFSTFDEIASRRMLTIKTIKELDAAIPELAPRRPFTREELNALR